MRRAGTSAGAVVVGALLLASLSVVAWRQGRALEALESLDEVRRERALAEAEAASLHRRIEALESRGRILSLARERLGMHIPDASEIRFLPAEAP